MYYIYNIYDMVFIFLLTSQLLLFALYMRNCVFWLSPSTHSFLNIGCVPVRTPMLPYSPSLFKFRVFTLLLLPSYVTETSGQHISKIFSYRCSKLVQYLEKNCIYCEIDIIRLIELPVDIWMFSINIEPKGIIINWYFAISYIVKMKWHDVEWEHKSFAL